MSFQRNNYISEQQGDSTPSLHFGSDSLAPILNRGIKQHSQQNSIECFSPDCYQNSWYQAELKTPLKQKQQKQYYQQTQKFVPTDYYDMQQQQPIYQQYQQKQNSLNNCSVQYRRDARATPEQNLNCPVQYRRDARVTNLQNYDIVGTRAFQNRNCGVDQLSPAILSKNFQNSSYGVDQLSPVALSKTIFQKQNISQLSSSTSQKTSSVPESLQVPKLAASVVSPQQAPIKQFKSMFDSDFPVVEFDPKKSIFYTDNYDSCQKVQNNQSCVPEPQKVSKQVKKPKRKMTSKAKIIKKQANKNIKNNKKQLNQLQKYLQKELGDKQVCKSIPIYYQRNPRRVSRNPVGYYSYLLAKHSFNTKKHMPVQKIGTLKQLVQSSVKRKFQKEHLFQNKTLQAPETTLQINVLTRAQRKQQEKEPVDYQAFINDSVGTSKQQNSNRNKNNYVKQPQSMQDVSQDQVTIDNDITYGGVTQSQNDTAYEYGQNNQNTTFQSEDRYDYDNFYTLNRDKSFSFSKIKDSDSFKNFVQEQVFRNTEQIRSDYQQTLAQNQYLSTQVESLLQKQKEHSWKNLSQAQASERLAQDTQQKFKRVDEVYQQQQQSFGQNSQNVLENVQRQNQQIEQLEQRLQQLHQEASQSVCNLKVEVNNLKREFQLGNGNNTSELAQEIQNKIDRCNQQLFQNQQQFHSVRKSIEDKITSQGILINRMKQDLNDKIIQCIEQREEQQYLQQQQHPRRSISTERQTPSSTKLRNKTFSKVPKRTPSIRENLEEYYSDDEFDENRPNEYHKFSSEMYDGNYDPSLWLFRFETTARKFNLKSDQKLEQAKYHLTDFARDWAFNQDFEDFSQFKHMLKEQFSRDQEQAVKQLRLMKQTNSEDLETYLKRLRKTARISNLPDKELRDAFLDGITDSSYKYIVNFIKYDIKRNIGKTLSSFQVLEMINEHARENKNSSTVNKTFQKDRNYKVTRFPNKQKRFDKRAGYKEKKIQNFEVLPTDSEKDYESEQDEEQDYEEVSEEEDELKKINKHEVNCIQISETVPEGLDQSMSQNIEKVDNETTKLSTNNESNQVAESKMKELHYLQKKQDRNNQQILKTYQQKVEDKYKLPYFSSNVYNQHATVTMSLQQLLQESPSQYMKNLQFLVNCLKQNQLLGNKVNIDSLTSVTNQLQQSLYGITIPQSIEENTSNRHSQPQPVQESRKPTQYFNTTNSQPTQQPSQLRTSDYLQQNAEKHKQANQIQIESGVQNEVQHTQDQIANFTLYAKQKPSLNYIPLKLGKIELTGLYDTGANVSAISLQAIKRYKLFKELSKVSSNIFTANGNDERVTQVYKNAPLRIKNVQINTELYVTNSPQYEILIGQDVIEAIKAHVIEGIMYFKTPLNKDENLKLLQINTVTTINSVSNQLDEQSDEYQLEENDQQQFFDQLMSGISRVLQEIQDKKDMEDEYSNYPNRPEECFYIRNIEDIEREVLLSPEATQIQLPNEGGTYENIPPFPLYFYEYNNPGINWSMYQKEDHKFNKQALKYRNSILKGRVDEYPFCHINYFGESNFPYDQYQQPDYIIEKQIMEKALDGYKRLQTKSRKKYIKKRVFYATLQLAWRKQEEQDSTPIGLNNTCFQVDQPSKYQGEREQCFSNHEFQINSLISSNFNFYKALEINQLKAKDDKMKPQVVSKNSKVEATKNTLDKEKLYPNFPINKKYDFIYMDIPWKYQDLKSTFTPKYPVLGLDELKLLPIEKIAKQDCIMCLWVTGPMLKKVQQLIQHWKFTYKQVFINWIKQNQEGKIQYKPGKYSETASEFLLLATKGNIEQMLNLEKTVQQILYSEITEHSTKPKEIYKILQEKFKIKELKCIEIFARNTHKNFDSYGDQFKEYYLPKQMNQLSQEETSQRVRTIMDMIQEQESSLRRPMEKLVKQYINLFAFNKSEIGITNVLQHHIILESDRILPIKKKPYKLAQIEEEFIAKEIQMLLDLNCIEPANTDWAQPIILVRKSSGEFRMCIDYRPLNRYTVTENHPIPAIDDIFLKLRNAKIYTKLDLKSGFWQVEVHPDSRHFTGFISPLGIFQWKVMPFGLKNAPSTFQNLMEKVLAQYLRKFVMVYIDDIIIYSNSVEEHVLHLSKIFELLKEANLKIGYDKCELFTKQVQLLGHVISHKEVRPLQSRIDKILKIPPPTDKTPLKSFLGICNYYRNFVPNYAQVTSSLYHLLKNKVDYVWTNDQQKAFDELKTILTTKPLLFMPRDDCQYQLYTDFCETGIAAILAQKYQGEEMVIEYASRSLRGAEKNYPAYEGEILAIHWALQKFRHYVLGKQFTIITDNKALSQVLTNEKQSKKILRWIMALQEFNFDTIHRPGKEHGNVDGLSRLTLENKSKKQLNNVFKVPDIGDVKCKKCKQTHSEDENAIILCDNCGCGIHYKCQTQEVDKNLFYYCETCIVEISNLKEKDVTQDLHVQRYLFYKTFPQPCTEQERQRILKTSTLYSVRHNRIYIKHQGKLKLVPSVSERKLLIEEQHEILGHPSKDKTAYALSNNFYWKSMQTEVEFHVDHCEVCQSHKPNFNPLDLYYPTQKGLKPFEVISIDLIPDLGKGTYKHLIIAVCCQSKYVEMRALPNKNSITIAKWFFEDIVSNHGCPYEVRCDQGSEFKKTFQTMLYNLGVKVIRSSTGYQQSNGQSEIYVQRITELFRRFQNDPAQKLQWYDAVPYVKLSLRASPHSVTKISPYEIIKGEPMRLPTSVVVQKFEPDRLTNEDLEYRSKLIKQLKRDIFTNVNENIQKQDEKRTRNYKYKGCNQHNLQPNDRVYVRVTQRKTKLQSPSKGPYFFLRYLNDKTKQSAELYNPTTRRKVNVSVTNICPVNIVQNEDIDDSDLE